MILRIASSTIIIIIIIIKSAEALVVGIKEIGLELNADKTK